MDKKGEDDSTTMGSESIIRIFLIFAAVILLTFITYKIVIGMTR